MGLAHEVGRASGLGGSASSTGPSPRGGSAAPATSDSSPRLAGRRRLAPRGFTLLELIVTLFVIALAAAIVMPSIGRGSEGLRVRAAVAGFSAFLRRTREEAITSRADLAVTVDPTARVLLEETVDNQVRARRALPERVTIEADPPAALTVHFSPEGFSTGGTFRVAGQSGVAYRVTVDPLSGRVLSRREPSQ